MADPTAPDNLTAIWQGIAAFGIFVGGVIAALFGRGKKSSSEDGEPSYRDQLREERFERKMETVLAAHRKAIEDTQIEFQEKIHQKIDNLSEERRASIRDLEDRVRDLERGR